MHPGDHPRVQLLRGPYELPLQPQTNRRRRAFLGNELSQLERDAISAVGELAMREDVRLDMNFQPGDIQLLNNHCILHARAGYQDSGRQKRLLLRMWINTYNSRKLAPDFADRLNTGPPWRSGCASVSWGRARV